MVSADRAYAPENSGRCMYYTYREYGGTNSGILTAYFYYQQGSSRRATIELTGLEPGTRYSFHVTVDEEASEGSLGFYGTTLGPNTGISDIAISNVTQRSADATATIENASTDAKFVYWHYRTSPTDGEPGSWSDTAKDSTEGATFPIDINNLNAGTRYEVEASVKDNFNTGMSMTKAFVTLPEKPGRPDVTSGDGELVVSWTAPTETPAPLTGYRVQWQDYDEYYSIDHPRPTATLGYEDVAADVLTYTIPNLTNGKDYIVEVIAKNDSFDDFGGTSSDGEFGTPMTIPHAPNNLQVAPGNTKLTLTWDEPTTKVGVTVNGYKVQWKEDSVADWDSQTGVTEVSVSGLTHEITGLTNGTTYDVRVRADNGITSDNYNWTEDDGTPRPDPIVKGVTVADSTITQTEATATVAINNETDDGQTVHLRHRVNTPGSSWKDEPTKSAAPADTSVNFSLSSLAGNTEHVVEAWLATTSSTKASVEFTTDPVEPDAPRNVEITVFGDGELTVAWDAPLGNGGSTITGYKVQWKEETTPNWDSPSEESGSSCVTLHHRESDRRNEI